MGEFLKQRAEEFLEEAEALLKKKKYDLSAFHFQQAAELLLKYSLWQRFGFYPPTHSLQELLQKLAKVWDKKKLINRLMKKNQQIILNLERAYIECRYFPVSFTTDELLQMQKFSRELFKLLRI